MIGQPVSAAALQTVAASCPSRNKWHPYDQSEVPDPQCDLDYVPNVSRVARIKHVLINGHSFGGSVAALVVGRVTS
jgi:3-oxoacyl-[acyl-carrier-protein] synthase II